MRIRVLTKPGHLASQETRQREPLTFGVPLPSGVVRDISHWAFYSADGPGRPVQARVLDRWADGSARWVLVDAQADVAAHRDTECYIDCDSGPQTHVEPRITITESAGTLTVDAGGARFRLRAGGAFPFD